MSAASVLDTLETDRLVLRHRRVGEAGYPRLWATVWDWNVASRRVLEKLGFRETGQVDPGAVGADNLLTVREF